MQTLAPDSPTNSIRRNNSLPRRLQSIVQVVFPYFLAATISIFVLNFLYHLSHIDLTIPLFYVGDSTFYDAVVKNFVETGHYNINPLLGAPGQQEMYDFPITHATHFLGFAILRLFTHNYGLVINLYYLLTYPLISIASLYTFRRLGVSTGLGIAGSILFAFLPFHVLRGANHLMHSSYYLVPLVVLSVLWIAHGHSLFRFDITNGRRKGLGLVTRDGSLALAVCALVGMDNPYWAFFSGIFLMAGGVLGRFRFGHRRALYSSCILALVLSLTFGLNLLPNIIYASRHGLNPISHRGPQEAEVYGGKIIQLLLPVSNHRIPALAKWKAAYNASAPLISENNTATLGIIGSIGFVSLFAAFYIKPFNNMFDSVSIMNLSAVLIFTMGGAGALFSYLVWSQLRGYNRISVYIGFFSILALLILSDLFLDHTADWSKPWLRSFVVPLALLGIGLADQIPVHFMQKRDEIEASYRGDQAFVGQIESLVGPHKMIFELPYAAFPGQAPWNTQMSGYDELKGYLHSSSLRWSGGAMIGREEDLWIHSVSAKPVSQMVASILAAGFSGIYIDRYGYTDQGASIEARLGQLLGEEPLASGDGRHSFFLLDQSIAGRIKEPVARYFEADAGTPCKGLFDFTNDGRVPDNALQGFSVAEPHGRWTDGNEATFVCTLPTRDEKPPATVRITTWGYVYSGHSQRAIISINGLKATEVRFGPGNDREVIELPLPSSPGNKLSIEFFLPDAVSPRELGMNSDPRKIAINVGTIEFR
jgi:hypothetical protein